jgi:hypothetical protein
MGVVVTPSASNRTHDGDGVAKATVLTEEGECFTVG